MDDISVKNFRPGQTNIKGSDGLPLACRSQTKGQSELGHILFLFHELAGQFMKQKQNMS